MKAAEIVTVSKILSAPAKAGKAASNVKPQGKVANGTSFASACEGQAAALQTAARAEAAGRESLRGIMAGLVASAAKNGVTRADGGKVLAAALGLPNMSRVRKEAGKTVSAEPWIVSVVNAWQYAAKALESRQPAAGKPAKPGKDEAGEAGEAGEETATREGKVETAAEFVALYIAFHKRHKAAALEALAMLAAREGMELVKPAKLAKAA